MIYVGPFSQSRANELKRQADHAACSPRPALQRADADVLPHQARSFRREPVPGSDQRNVESVPRETRAFLPKDAGIVGSVNRGEMHGLQALWAIHFSTRHRPVYENNIENDSENV